MAATTAKAVATPTQADYGIDAPGKVRETLIRGALIFLLGFGLWYMNRVENPRGGAALFTVLAIIGVVYLAMGGFMLWSSRTGKLAVRDSMLDALPWRGDEMVLDAGCGRGLLLIGAARRLAKGKVTGIDSWSTGSSSKNSAEATLANARAEGVADRVKIENGDVRRMPYKPATYDTVVSSLSLHDVGDETERAKALDEILRVTKPGGHIAIWDVHHAPDYLRHLTNAGAQVVKQSGTSFLWCVPSRWFVVKR